MSSTGMMRDTTPLFPWRPAILSPSERVRVWAIQTRTSLLTPGERSSPFSRVMTLTSMIFPRSPCGTRREVSFTSRGLLAEYRPQELLLGGQFGLALGRDLADEDVSGANLGPDADDALLIEVAERILSDVGDVTP